MRLNSKVAFVFVFLAVYGSACLSGCFGGPLVFDFESGDLAQEGWKIVEGENSKPIGNREITFHTKDVPYQKHGRHYLTTLESTQNDAPTDDTICILESPVFVLNGKETKILVGGGRRPNTYLGLCPLEEDGSVGPPIRKAQGRNTADLDEVVWDTSDLLGKPFVLQLVDLEIGGWAHIRMDYFRCDGHIDAKKTATRDHYIQTVIAERKAAEKAATEVARKNPVLNAQPILYVTRHQYRPDHGNTETTFQTNEVTTHSFTPGGSLRLWNPQDDSVRMLIDVPQGVVRDPDLSFDGKSVLLSLRRNIEDDYHIYELLLEPWLSGLPAKGPLTILPETNLEGTPLKQLTLMSGVSDIDPIYLPSGEIVFSSSREPKFCMCNRHIMVNLYKMNGDGSNIRQIGKSTLYEAHASLTPDGNIVYFRWEYVDRNFGDAQGIWITTPDGFNHSIFWGNNTASPGAVLDPKIIPGSNSEFICTFAACHDRPWGAIALVDRQRAIDGREAVLQTWPASAIELVDVGNYDTFIKVFPKMEDPFPLTSEWFLASGMTGRGEQMGIWLLGRDGTMAMVHCDQNAPGCFDPIPLVPRTPPPIKTQSPDWNDPNGYFLVSNVYEGFGMDTVEKGAVQSLRIVESPEKRTWSPQDWQNGTGQMYPGMGWKDFNNKRILGTVPVEDDGSAHFAVPADTYVYFQLLDEKGRMIQTMRSGVIVRPGEYIGCYGCHEDRLMTFPALKSSPKAMQRNPDMMKGWHGKPRFFSYVKEVQEPVFDRFCVTCHDYGQVESLPKMPNLAGDLNTIFSTSYVELQNRQLVNAIGAGPHVKLKPYTWGATQSRLANILLKGHPDPAIDGRRKELGVYIDGDSHPEIVDRVLTWIDLNTPYYGVYETSFPDNRYGRCPLPNDKLSRLAELTGVRERELDWGVSFTRPEISPCLAKWKTEEEKQTPQYREALRIIREGKRLLDALPRGEDPETVALMPRDEDQLKKYDKLRRREYDMREAIRQNKRLYDTTMP